MGLDDRPHRQPSSPPHPQRPAPPKARYHHTADYKQPPPAPPPPSQHHARYATAPAHLDKPPSGGNLDKKILVSLISQSEYMKRHLYIKTGVDRDRPVLRYQLRKASIRNYTPKAINQDINMGMWM